MRQIPDDLDIVHLLYLSGKQELILETAKQKLVTECEDFNVIDAFRIIDKQALGAVDPHDVKKVLEEIGVDHDEDDLILFF